MGKITKELKEAVFSYDEASKTFTINQGEGFIKLNKVYAFAFMRFVIRMAQRNWLRPKLKLVEAKKKTLSLEEIPINPDQSEFMSSFEEGQDFSTDIIEYSEQP
tara:strand:+ start:108 stop:419 length:312 start_codon:yes stop_codon:yes gene_type:complete